MDLSMIRVYRVTTLAVGTLHLDSVKQVASEWVAWQEHRESVHVTYETNTIFSV